VGLVSRSPIAPAGKLGILKIPVGCEPPMDVGVALAGVDLGIEGSIVDPMEAPMEGEGRLE
jgi:hypothetical protein